MAPSKSDSGGVLVFAVAALLVGVVVLGYLVYTGGKVLPQHNSPSFSLMVKPPPATKTGG